MAIVSRLQLDHPALGTAGGAALHSQIEAIYQKLGDSVATRFFVVQNLLDTEDFDLEHKFGSPLETIRYDLYLYDDSGPDVVLTEITQAGSPSLAELPVVDKVGDENTIATITNNSGGTLNLAIVMLHDPIDLREIRDVDLDSEAPEDGQALVYNAALGAWVPGASGDASFKIQSVEDDGTTVIKGGFLIDDAGVEYATYSGTGDTEDEFGVDIEIDLNEIIDTPDDDTSYYLYIDKHSLDDAVETTDTTRIVVGVTEENFVLFEEAPDLVNLARYIPIGLVSRATASWDEQVFRTLAFRRHSAPSVAVSPLVETLVGTIGEVGDVGNMAGGHELDADSLPSAVTDANGSIYNLNDANDALGTRNLTNNNSVPFTATGVEGEVNSAASFNGSNQSLSSTAAFFNPGDASFAFGAWFAATDWTPATTQVLAGKNASSTDRGWVIALQTDGRITFEAPASATALVSRPFFHEFVDGAWHHLALTYNTNNKMWRFYVDGSLVDTLTQTNRTVTSNIFRLGSYNDTADLFFAGRIDEAFYANALLSSSDIAKLAAVRIDLSNTSVDPVNQRWEAELSHGDFSSQYGSDFLLDKKREKIYVDFGGGPSDGEVTLKLYDTQISTRTIPARDFNKIFTSDPGTTIAHGLPDMPAGVQILHDELGDGQYREVGSDLGVKWDEQNLYVDLSSLTISASQPIKIIASAAPLAVAISKSQLDNMTPDFITITSNYTAKHGDKILADSSGGSFTITLPSMVGSVVEVYDIGSLLENNVTVEAVDSADIDGEDNDILDEDGLRVTYIRTASEWRSF